MARSDGGGREWEWERIRERQREMARGLRMECACGAGLCTVKPIRLNPRFLFLCCPRGQADAGGCGFMQWRDTVVLDNISTSPSTRTFASPDAPPPQTPMPCPCGAGPCSVGIASNNRTFYSCSVCKFKKWCDAGAPSQCYICREEGHWSSDCPRLPPSAAAAAAANRKICFYCKNEGHFAASCPVKYPPTRN